MDLSFSAVTTAFLLTLGAGLATGIGGLIAVAGKGVSRSVLSAALGFSAGVMIYISFVELLGDAFETLQETCGQQLGGWLAIGGFFGGIGLIALIDHFVPESENPHELQGVECALTDDMGENITAESGMYDKNAPFESSTWASLEGGAFPASDVASAPSASDTSSNAASTNDLNPREKALLMRTGIMSALAIGIHNFPEGMASFFSSLSDPALGVSIAVAIAIHNIPEGISVAIPLRYATGNRAKAAFLALTSGLAEPVGALIGFVILRPFINDSVMGMVFAMVAGIMVFISLDELLPAAEKTARHHVAIGGLIAGMFVMAFSLQIM